ncbi:MAG: phytanoyl-CoA dioxygenase family protein [Pseudomonadota bacterium]
MHLTSAQQQQYREDGFLAFPGLFSPDEVVQLKQEAERVATIDSELVVREGETQVPKIMFRLHELDSPTASTAYHIAAHSPRVLGISQQLLGDDAVYMHHCKVNMKAAIEGSAWPWHQDFGSWHLDGIQRPEMLTVMLMLDEVNELNGCLYFLPGSHRDGRTTPYWDESTAYKLWAVKPNDVREYMLDGNAPVPIVGPAGTAVVFDCNLLHASGHNLSAHHRWQVYFCFNRVTNRPVDVENPRPEYVRSTNWSPMELVTGDARIA